VALARPGAASTMDGCASPEVMREPLAGYRRRRRVTCGRRAAAHGRRVGCLAAGILIGFGLAGCGQVPHGNPGALTEFFTGVVLASPANCVRVTQPASLSVLGLLCLQRSPGPAGSCVHGAVSNGGRLADGITRLPGGGHQLAAARCRPSPTLAEFVREGQIIGVVWTDPRCLAVPLPYPGSHHGLICAAHPIGTAGECVQTYYQVPQARSGGSPFDGGVTRSPPAWCKGLRRW
jgi:hypothetical protein